MIPAGLQGVAQILRFNWHWYVLALALDAVAMGVVRIAPGPGPYLVAGAAAGTAWLLLSLAASHVVYDRSGLRAGRWIERLALAPPGRVVVLHTGHDEATGPVKHHWPDSRVEVFDVFDPEAPAEASLLRARAAAPTHAPSAHGHALPVATGSVDLVCGVFALHEIRRAGDRAALFREIQRVLTPGGALVVVEHLRDPWNLLAYGPGAFHFLSRRTWEASFAAGGMRVAQMVRCTPFVAIYRLEAFRDPA